MKNQIQTREFFAFRKYFIYNFIDYKCDVLINVDRRLIFLGNVIHFFYKNQ